MEVKLSQRSHFSFPQCKTTTKKLFKGLAESQRFQLLEMSKLKGHFVKECETLNSTSRQEDGMSFPSIVAANKNKSDVEFLYKGQLPGIPAFVPANAKLYQIKRRPQSSMNIFDGCLNQKAIITSTANGLSHALQRYNQAKSIGYFLLLAPLVAFCITCMLGAFHTRVPRDMGQQAEDESRKNYEGTRSMRWKNALNEIKESDTLDSESTKEINNASDDEDTSHAYRKLEQDYEKFLSECGMSKSGYWRGGLRK